MVAPMPRSGRFIPAATIIAACTLGSRILGLARECVFGYFFSTSELLSAFRIAFMAPNLARRLFGEGALSSAMIPVLTDTIETRGDQASRRFVGSLLTALAVVLTVVVLLGEGGIAAWRTTNDDPALELAAILLPYMGFICIVAILGAVLNVRRHFATPAASPMILNVAIVVAIVGGSVVAGLEGKELMYAACGGVLVAGVLQVLAVGVALSATSFFPVFGTAWRDPQIKRVTRLMAPMILGLAAVQINSLVDYVIAYLFIHVDGHRVGPAVLGYAQYLYQLPLGVFGIAIATAIFPVLSQNATEGDRKGFAATFGTGIRMSLFIALPATVGLMFVAHPLVATLFERGKFDESDTQRVAATLFFYAIGMAAYFAQHILVRTLYAMKNSKTPARISLWMVSLNFAMNLSLVFVMQERGLALATAVCAVIQAVWLARRLAMDMSEIAWGNIGRGVMRMIAATAVMAVVLGALAWLPAMDRLFGESDALRLAALVLAGVGTYTLAAKTLGIAEVRTVFRFKQKSE